MENNRTTNQEMKILSSNSATAELNSNSGSGVQEESQRSWRLRWFNKFIDVKEAKIQILFSFPMILTNVFYHLVSLVSVMFAGHLGELELAGATLANSWATVTGFAFMTGLSGALETLCGQGYGARLYKMLGIYLQASCIISLFFTVIISIIWFYTEQILILIKQDPEISAMAALYMKFLIPGLFAFGVLQNILRFFQTQSITIPLVILAFIPMSSHVGITYGLVHHTSLGYRGAPLALSISQWVAAVLLGLYVIFSKKFQHTWDGFSLETFRYIVIDVKLALPSAAMVCLEYWAFEILVFLAGLMPNSKITTSLIAICVNTQAIAFMLTYGLSAAASTRVSNELGAGSPNRAKGAMVVTLKLSVIVAIILVSALAFGHRFWVDLFTNSYVIVREFGSMTPFLAASIALDAFQGVLSGAARGCGLQQYAVYANLATFYFIGMPIACLLGFKLKLYVKGLWIGLICGLCCQAASLLLITVRTKWTPTNLSIRDEENPTMF